jgi:hypothetical protein
MTPRGIGLDSAIERAREADILNLVERLGAKLKRVGASEYVGPCPVCGGRDRFGVNIKKRLWNCRGCGKGGESSPSRSTPEVRRSPKSSRRSPARRAPVSNLRRESAILTPRTMTFVVGATRRAGCGLSGSRWGFHRGNVPQEGARLRRAATGRAGLPEAVQRLSALAHRRLRNAGGVRARCLARAARYRGRPTDRAQDRRLRQGRRRDQEAHDRLSQGRADRRRAANDLLAISVHEGIEDALSAHDATGLGAWASGGASFLPHLADAIPAYVETITVVAHRDEAGRIGARELARRLAARGFKVLLHGGA